MEAKIQYKNERNCVRSAKILEEEACRAFYKKTIHTPLLLIGVGFLLFISFL